MNCNFVQVMFVDRIASVLVKNHLHKGKTIVLTGPRQVGKTSLIEGILEKYKNVLLLNGDDSDVRISLSQHNAKLIEKIIGNNTIVFIDEAQRIDNIGLTAKIIHDKFKKVQLILTGSSTLDLNSAVNESLTGRKLSMNLFPISMQELVNHSNFLEVNSDLENRILFGMYPEVITSKGQEENILRELSESYLYKDILALSNIKKPDILHKLVQALAYQIGSEVSLNELSSLLSISKETVGSYIQLLEKAFVIFTVPSLARNLRNEIKANRKIYFFDTGIRNAVIQSFNPLQLRSDKGALWENFLISERIKFNKYRNYNCLNYFWRTTEQQEIDWIEEKNAHFTAVEFKWQKAEKAKLPKKFASAYPKHNFAAFDSNNYWEFILD